MTVSYKVTSTSTIITAVSRTFDNVSTWIEAFKSTQTSLDILRVTDILVAALVLVLGACASPSLG
jgi:hypothetical protein